MKYDNNTQHREEEPQNINSHKTSESQLKEVSKLFYKYMYKHRRTFKPGLFMFYIDFSK